MCCYYLPRRRRKKKTKNQFTCHANEYKIRWVFFFVSHSHHHHTCTKIRNLSMTMKSLLHRPCYGPFKMFIITLIYETFHALWHFSRSLARHFFFGFGFVLFQGSNSKWVNERDRSIFHVALNLHIFITHCYLEWCTVHINTILWCVWTNSK